MTVWHLAIVRQPDQVYKSLYNTHIYINIIRHPPDRFWTTYNCEPRRRIRRSSSTVRTGLPLSGLGLSSFCISSDGCGTRYDGLRDPGKAICGAIVPSPGERCNCTAWLAACKQLLLNTSYADFLYYIFTQYIYQKYIQIFLHRLICVCLCVCEVPISSKYGICVCDDESCRCW